MNHILLGILAYVLLQLLIGFWVSRKIKTEDDYLLAGRSLGYVLATFSIFATWFGAESCIGTAGAAYSSGLSGVRADPFGYGICLILMGLVFAVPLYKLRLTTIADFFKIRFSGKVEKLTAMLMIPTSLFWAAAQIRAFGLVLSASSELNISTTIAISALIVIIYTVSGGLLADAWTDVIQGSVLIIGLLILLPIIFMNNGGVASTLSIIDMNKLNFIGESDASSHFNFLSFVESWAIPICGSIVAQEVVSRVLASRSINVAKRSSLFAGGIYIFMGMIPLTIGLIGFSILPALQNEEQVLPMMAQKYLSPMLYVFFAGALVSAILSTVDSSLLACSALFSHNIVIPHQKNINEKKKVLIERGAVVGMGLLAYVLAVHAEGVYNLVKDASAFGSAGIFVAVMFGMFTKFGNGEAALTALASGAITWIIGHYILNFEISYLLSILVSVTGYVLVSIFYKGEENLIHVEIEK